MWKDKAYLIDMLEAAREIQQLTDDLDQEQFRSNQVLQLAVEKLLEIVGEAARRIAEDTKTAHPAIAWRKIIGLRNILIHDYGEVDLDVIWIILQNDIRPLITHLEQIVPPEPPQVTE